MTSALFKAILLASVAAVGLGVGQVSAQINFGPVVPVKDVDPVIKAAAEVMGVVRTRALIIGQVNMPEMVGSGTMVDVEAPTLGQPVQVSRYTYVVSMQLGASRIDFEGPNTPRTIRVVKGGRAWNEKWSDDKKKLSTSPADAAATYRAQMLWLQPHFWLQTAAFASVKRCWDGKAC